MAQIRLDQTLLQWTTYRFGDDFLDYCNQYPFMKLRRETDYCYTVYYDKDHSGDMHYVLDRAIDLYLDKTSLAA